MIILKLLLAFYNRGWSITVSLKTILLTFDLLHSFIDNLELIWPISRIEKWPHIISIIITAFRIEMEWWRQNRAFMTIDWIESKESFYFQSKFINTLVYLFEIHTIEHRNRTQALYFTKFTENTQLCIG